jgi:hypothetical protein
MSALPPIATAKADITRHERIADTTDNDNYRRLQTSVIRHDTNVGFIDQSAPRNALPKVLIFSAPCLESHAFGRKFNRLNGDPICRSVEVR